jgi:DNA-binding MarR family transcriptional regulator
MVDHPRDDPTTSIPHILAGLDGLNQRIGVGLARRIGSAAPTLRGSQGRILSLIGPDGTRPTVLADGWSITKQAMGKRIQDLEARGLVTVEPDPSDGRAVVVRRTPEGDRVKELIAAQIADLEHELAQLVGAQRYAEFRSVLDELAADHLPAAVAALTRDRGSVRGSTT